MFTEGHIAVKRTIKDWSWYNDPKMFTLFLHMLIDANYTNAEWEGHAIKRGQLVTSVALLSADTGLSIQEVRTCLKKLGGAGEVRSTSIGRRSIITICNYERYLTAQQGPNAESTSMQRAIIEESKKIEEKKPSNDGKEKNDIANRLYALYPTKCPVSGRATGKSSKDKEKLARLLKDHTEQELSETIKRYVKESTEQQSYIKNFSTFLNNLPDYSAKEQQTLAQSPTTQSYEDALEKAKNPTKEEIKAWWDKRMAPFYPKNPDETNAQYRARVRPSYESELKSWIDDRTERVKQRYL